MTGTNPLHNGPGQQPGKAEETVQWWSTPPANTGPGTPVTGADPTVLGGAQFNAYPQQPYAPPQQGYPGQPYGAPYQQGYPAQPFTPPPPRRGNTGWIIAAVIGLVVVVGVVIGAIALTGTSDDHKSAVGPTVDKKKTDGNYSMTNVTSACALVDPTVLRKWAPNPKGTPEHTERQPDTNYGGGSLSCRAQYDGAGKYGSQGSDLKLDAGFASLYGTPDFNNWKDYDTKTTGSGRSSGAITGLGEQAYYAVYEQNYSTFTSLDYTCAVLDSNLSAKITLSIESATPTNRDDIATTCKDQLKKVLTTLHK
ncbi:hypothetical protein [Nocardia terpenica]|uniref:DUF3558 domain-containing protein n=1 Tax=Nocardia terpenica TaxID=455432 RepID=A0A164HIY5_9NOCA|nr:hypothetical protein [Nocardia terpenica]KZM68557.1 hypothetical protein AWN90_11905 [Nocardia terpenica]NQE88480.1 hypothetical protein [Nocardia terpenica]